MCGIAGLVSRQPLTEKEHQSVSEMNACLAHRGPDGDGFFQREHVSLAMRRLSIIDLDGGWQPIYNEDQSLAVLCNGEIYNFVELRKELERKGHRYNTNSDVENIVHLYEEYGLDLVHHLRGMYAFVLWDEKRQRLILGRDRMGEKPLYLHERDGQIFYGSEIKSFLKTGLVPLELDPVAVDWYFHYHYVPEPLTPVKGIRKLPAGHIMVIDVENWQVEETCYWRMEDAEPIDGDPAQLIREELERVSEIVVRSDVPVGVALSGGIDSSVVTTMAVQKYPGTIEAFSVGYPGAGAMDERDDARALAKHLKIPFHDIELHQSDMLEFFPELVGWRDDPIADISGYGYYMVQRLAREHNVPVMLQGQGGDELFWGYDWVRAAMGETLAKAGSNRPNLKNLIESIEVVAPTGLSRAGLGPFVYALGGIVPTLQRFKRRTLNDPTQMIFYDKARDFVHATNNTHSLYPTEWRAQLQGRSPFEVFRVPQPWGDVGVELTRLISQTYLLENGIAQGDRLSMASSVELRLPLLDYKFVETVIGLRKNNPDHHLPPKYWLKEAVKDIVPDWVLNRPKRGFEPPVRDWHTGLFERYGDNLIDGALVSQGVLTGQAARQLSGGVFPKTVTVPMSFKALVLETWLREMGA